MTKEELKQGYQPKSCNLKNIVPPSVSTNVKPKKDGYTWEDLDKAWWEGFDNAKNKMEKRIAELKAQIEKMKCCGNCDWKVKGICNDNDNCELEDWKLVETWR